MLQRLKNPGTIVSLASLIILILTTVGIQIDDNKIMTIIKAICAIGIILGVLNNPDTPGIDFPEIKK